MVLEVDWICDRKSMILPRLLGDLGMLSCSKAIVMNWLSCEIASC